MKLLCTLLLILPFTFLAQPSTEIYVFDAAISEEHFSVSNLQNISNNEGYDNQPFFTKEGSLLFAKTRDGQTDIFEQSLRGNNGIWISNQTPGGEYSPQSIPGSEDIAAVRLDPDGKQRLYRYAKGFPTAEILKNIQVAYYTFIDEKTILASVLSGNKLDLIWANTQTQKVDTLVPNSGRSIHRVPQQKNMMSYTATNEDGQLDVYQWDKDSKESFFVVTLPIGVQDMIWLDDARILIGSGPYLFLYDLYEHGDWEKVADFSSDAIADITRLAISPNGEKIAIVAAPSQN